MTQAFTDAQLQYRGHAEEIEDLTIELIVQEEWLDELKDMLAVEDSRLEMMDEVQAGKNEAQRKALLVTARSLDEDYQKVRLEVKKAERCIAEQKARIERAKNGKAEWSLFMRYMAAMRDSDDE